MSGFFVALFVVLVLVSAWRAHRAGPTGFHPGVERGLNFFGSVWAGRRGGDGPGTF